MKSFAFYGRVSSDDAQDPSLSIPRQLSACERAVAASGGEIVCCYWDIESGRKALEDRGQGSSSWRERVAVPCAGGLPELLAAAYHGEPFYAVIVESIDRLSRMTADATRIERELEQRDIGLFAADEPMSTDATSMLTRRIKQGVAEWYVRDLIERSRRGMEESVRQGWHTGGRAPYGYLLEEHRHPNPAKAREGKRKHRLILDPVRAPVVLMIFEDYCLRRLGLGEIINKLNSDLDRYPPASGQPQGRDRGSGRPGTARRCGRCCATRSTPATTSGAATTNAPDDPASGRASSGSGARRRPTPRSSRRSCSSRSVTAPGTTSTPPRKHRLPTPLAHQTPRTRLSICAAECAALCADDGWRAPTRRAPTTTAAVSTPPAGPALPRGAGHPGALQIKEDIVLDAVLEFMGRRLFGPERLERLRERTRPREWRSR